MSHVAVVGAGSIGVGWALVLARAGHDVRVQDPDAERRAALSGELGDRLEQLAAHDLLAEAPAAVAARVRACAGLADAVEGAVLVQECAPEDLALKRELFAQLDRLAPADVPLASSSSALTASSFSAELEGAGRCLVAHPGNPPFLLPVVELVPSPATRPEVVDRVEALLVAAGMSPVRVAVEQEGFVFNRLQGALLREAYCLVRDGVCSVEDVDRVVRDGLGRRWAFLGPFEVADLNTRGGIARHAERLGPAYARMGAERGQDDPWTPELVAEVADQRRAELDIEAWEDRVAWRDRMLMELARVVGPSGPPRAGR